MVGGSMLAFQKVEPLLRSLGTTVVWMGGPGSGQVAKACNQLVVAANIEAVAEALVLAKKCGLDPARVRMALEGGFAGSAALTIHGSRMLRHDFEPGARAALHVKDADIFESLSREAGVPIPLGAAARVALHSLAKSGKGDLDHSALVLPLEEASGCSVEADAEPT
jgi:2-hydroxy-3-oxopropionate reductase